VKQQVGDLPLESTAPGKAVLFGEHAVVYGQPGIAASLSLGLTVRLSHDPDGPRFVLPKFRQPFPIQEHESDYQLFSQATSQALEMHGLAKAPIAIEIEGELIPGMGLGSSAAFSVALITALRRFKKLDWQRRYTPELFREVQKLEEVFHGSPSGMDAATVLNGGVLWFRNGEPRELLPIRIPVSASGVICIVEPAPRTADVVQQVRLERELSPRRIEALIDEIGRVAIEGAFALGLGDLAQVGELMFANHELLARLGVSTPALDSAVERLREMGALGAKLTGAGAGGAIIALVPREKQLMFLEELEKEYALVLPFNVGEGM